MARIKPSPDDTRRLQLILPTALFEAADKAAKKNGEPAAAFIRRAIADAVGHPELAEMRGRGNRPKPQ